MPEPWYLYMLLCVDNTIYTGVAKDLPKRLAKHAIGKGAKYMRSRLPFTLIHSETLPDHGSALKRELEVKSFPRKKKLALAKIDTPS